MIKGLDHVAIAVKSVEEVLKIYDQVLGLKAEKVKVVEQQKVKVGAIRVGETKIELLEPTGPESTVARFLEKRGEGIHHIALQVSDIGATISELRQKGATMIDEKPRMGFEGKKIAFINPKSTANVLIELVET